jgi:hypothetical protein
MLEVAVAVALLSIVLVGVAAGLVTLFRATKVNDEASATAAAVITYGEIIRSQVPYVECAPGRSVPQAYNALSRGFLTTTTTTPTSTTTTTTPLPSCVANLAACATTTSTSTTTTTTTPPPSIPVAQAWAVPAGMTVQVVDVRKWVPEAAGFATSTTGTSSTSSSTVPPLSACTPTDSGAQLVTIRATQGTFSRTAEIVKWRPGPS